MKYKVDEFSLIKLLDREGYERIAVKRLRIIVMAMELGDVTFTMVRDAIYKKGVCGGSAANALHYLSKVGLLVSNGVKVDGKSRAALWSVAPWIYDQMDKGAK